MIVKPMRPSTSSLLPLESSLLVVLSTLLIQSGQAALHTCPRPLILELHISAIWETALPLFCVGLPVSRISCLPLHQLTQWLPEIEYLGSKWVFKVLSANVVIYPASTIH